MNDLENKPHGIEVIVRAVITDSLHEKILACSPKSKEYFYLPGGHVEPGETAVQALKRELLEETGVETNILSYIPIGASENIFFQKNEKHHEVNIYFFVPGIFSESSEIISYEQDILFRILPAAALLLCENMIQPEHVFSWNGVPLSKPSTP
jgi:ADP-ribose pyrophosphatase YjhB (NUDIX family)